MRSGRIETTSDVKAKTLISFYNGGQKQVHTGQYTMNNEIDLLSWKSFSGIYLRLGYMHVVCLEKHIRFHKLLFLLYYGRMIEWLLPLSWETKKRLSAIFLGRILKSKIPDYSSYSEKYEKIVWYLIRIWE